MRRVLTLLCGVTLLAAAGCGVPGGVEVEGRASQVTPPPSTPTLPVGTPASTDVIAVMRADTTLDPKIKSLLVPCANGAYPVDERYIDFTGDGKAELMVNLYLCSPEPRAKLAPAGMPYGGGLAAYVYNIATKPPTRLFSVEDSAVELTPSIKNSQELLVIRNRWGPKDDPCCPTDQVVQAFRWNGAKFEVVE
jgi:hypothetical protein